MISVFPVSPNTFYAYLQAIVLGLNGLRIEKSARELQGYLSGLKVDLERVQRDYEILGRHLTNAYQKHSDVRDSLTRLGGKLETLDSGVSPLLPDGTEDPRNDTVT